jgi:hypothetical protein
MRTNIFKPFYIEKGHILFFELTSSAPGTSRHGPLFPEWCPRINRSLSNCGSLLLEDSMPFSFHELHCSRSHKSSHTFSPEYPCSGKLAISSTQFIDAICQTPTARCEHMTLKIFSGTSTPVWLIRKHLIKLDSLGHQERKLNRST